MVCEIKLTVTIILFGSLKREIELTKLNIAYIDVSKEDKQKSK